MADINTLANDSPPPEKFSDLVHRLADGTTVVANGQVDRSRVVLPVRGPDVMYVFASGIFNQRGEYVLSFNPKEEDNERDAAGRQFVVARPQVWRGTDPKAYPDPAEHHYADLAQLMKGKRWVVVVACNEREPRDHAAAAVQEGKADSLQGISPGFFAHMAPGGALRFLATVPPGYFTNSRTLGDPVSAALGELPVPQNDSNLPPELGQLTNAPTLWVVDRLEDGSVRLLDRGTFTLAMDPGQTKTRGTALGELSQFQRWQIGIKEWLHRKLGALRSGDPVTVRAALATDGGLLMARSEWDQTREAADSPISDRVPAARGLTPAVEDAMAKAARFAAFLSCSNWGIDLPVSATPPFSELGPDSYRMQIGDAGRMVKKLPPGIIPVDLNDPAPLLMTVRGTTVTGLPELPPDRVAETYDWRKACPALREQMALSQ